MPECLSSNAFAVKPDNKKFVTQTELDNAITGIATNTTAIAGLQSDLPTFYTIGDTGPAGGIVFYVDGDGLHGLEAAPSDQSTGIRWSNGSDTNTEAHGDGVGAGKMNTMLIIANQGSDSNSYAAGICANLMITYNGVSYGDWYLPSKYELNLMWENLADSDSDNTNPGTSDPNNLGGFANAYYWSSSETSSGTAWGQYFNYGLQGYGSKGGAGVRVRAVRAF
jgi:hypothetical protein